MIENGFTRERIGYLVPAFPGQTHAFFWREILSLKKLGIEVRLVSTRPPDLRIQCHSWAEKAKRSTVYLFPLSVVEMLSAISLIWHAGTSAWRGIKLGLFGGGFRRVPRNLALLFLGAKLVEISEREGWTHIHVHSCADSALIAAFASHLGSITYGLTLHGALAGYGPMQAFKWAGATYGLTVNHVLQDEVICAIGLNAPKTMEVAPMGVDLDSFSRRERYSPWRGDGPIRVVSCGRLHPGKGHQDLLQAVGFLVGGGLDISLRICGQDEAGGDGYARRLNELIHEMELASVAKLLGAASEQRVIAELESAHIFVLASHDEAIGVAYMEAMAMGVPTIGTKVGGVSELISDEVDGLLVNAMMPHDLAKSIERIARNPDLAIRLGIAARNKVEERFHSGVSACAIERNLGLVRSSPR